MRDLGARSIAVTCELCHHGAVLPADRWPDAVLVRAFRPRMVCTNRARVKQKAARRRPCSRHALLVVIPAD
jgi:hypothetical protein